MDTNLTTRLDILRRVPYLASLSEDVLRQLAARLSVRRYRAGSVIFFKGDASQGLYFVLAGRVATFAASPDGREQVLHAFGPGRTFGDIAAFDDGAHPGTARATGASTVALIPKVELQRILAPSLQALRLFASRLRAFTQIVEGLSLRPVVARIAGLLVDLARGEQTLVEDAASDALRLTQHQIAAMVGSVREVVQRELKVLEQAGAIALSRGEVRIIDVRKLERWREGESKPAER